MKTNDKKTSTPYTIEDIAKTLEGRNITTTRINQGIANIENVQNQNKINTKDEERGGKDER